MKLKNKWGKKSKMEKSILLNLVQNALFHKIIEGVGGGANELQVLESQLIHAIKVSR